VGDHLHQLALGLFDFVGDIARGQVAALDARHDRGEQFRRRERLGQVVVRAKFHAVPHESPVGASSQEDERHRRDLRNLTHFHQHGIAVHLRHGDVAHDHVGLELAGCRHAVAPIGRADDLEPLISQNLQDILAHRFFVFDHQDFGHQRALRA